MSKKLNSATRKRTGPFVAAMATVVLGMTISSIAAAKAPESSDHGKASSAAEDALKQQAMMKRAMELGSPSAHHRLLKNLVGRWRYTATFWMAPNTPGENTRGATRNKLIMGGRFLEQSVRGKWHKQRFEGKAYLGYDNIRKEYISIWFDNMGTGMMKGKGSYSEKDKTLSEEGSSSCPLTNEPDRWFRSETKIVDKRQYIFSMFTKGPKGKPFKSMEIVYKRR